MVRPPPPNLTEQDAKVQLPWPVYEMLTRRPSWRLAFVLMGGAGCLCGLCGFVQGLIAH